MRSCDRENKPALNARGARIIYHPGSSWLHQLHPLVKFAWLIWGTVFVFWVENVWAVLAVVLAAGIGFALCRVDLRQLRGWRLLIATATFLALLQILFISEGRVLLSLGPLNVTTRGLESGIYVGGRFLSVLMLSYLFVFTTEPNDLAYALMRMGLPYRYGFALITALRLVPVFEQEGQIVYRAQLARGIAYDTRNPRRFLTLARQFFFPLLVSALGKVDALAVSMEGRCFGKYPDRTFLREITFRWRDGLMVVLLAVLTLASIL